MSKSRKKQRRQTAVGTDPSLVFPVADQPPVTVPHLLPGDEFRIGGYAPIPPLDTSGDCSGLIRCDVDLMGYWLPPGVRASSIRIRDRMAPPEGD
jgi:hypothetical protein